MSRMKINMALLSFRSFVRFLGQKFFRLNPHKWHSLIARSPIVQKFFDLSPHMPPKIFKKKFFSKNMFLGVFGRDLIVRSKNECQIRVQRPRKHIRGIF